MGKNCNSLFNLNILGISIVSLFFFFATVETASADEPCEVINGIRVCKKQAEISIAVPVQEEELKAIGRLPGCTATLITDRLVLTAAHCVCSSQTTREGCSERTTFTFIDVYPAGSSDSDSAGTRQDVSIEGTVRVHPEYTMRGWLREDYAVVELDRPVQQVARDVVPISVESPFVIPRKGEKLTLVGFGRTGINCSGAGKGKQKLELPITEISRFGIKFQRQSEHACPGDSGGPVLNERGYVVGVASWTDEKSESYYRPTHSNYNWIMDLPRPQWVSCSWEAIGPMKSHSQGPAWCPEGKFLTQFDLDGGSNLRAHDAPIVGKAKFCTLAGNHVKGWESCTWVEVGAQKSHKQDPSWCPEGSFLTQFDLDGNSDLRAHDAPIVGRAKCCRPKGNTNKGWGSSYWEEVGPIKSHNQGEAWCPNGSFITQFDLDGDSSLGVHDAPIVGRVKCSRIGE